MRDKVHVATLFKIFGMTFYLKCRFKADILPQ